MLLILLSGLWILLFTCLVLLWVLILFRRVSDPLWAREREVRGGGKGEVKEEKEDVYGPSSRHNNKRSDGDVCVSSFLLSLIRSPYHFLF